MIKNILSLPTKTFSRISIIRRSLALSCCLSLLACGGGAGAPGTLGTTTGTTGGGIGVTGNGTGGNGGTTGGGGTGIGGDTPTGGAPGDTPGGGTTGGTGGGTGGAGGGSGGNTGVALDPTANGNGTTRAQGSSSGSFNGAGEATIPVTLANTTSFQIVVASTGNQIAAALFNGSLATIVAFIPPATTPQQTSAVFLNDNVNTMPYPTNGTDAAVTNGTYTEALLSNAPGAPFTTIVTAKHDNNLLSGAALVNVFLVGTQAQSSVSRDAVNSAIDIWKQVYAGANITLDVQTFDVSSGTGVLPNPTSGSEFYFKQPSESGARAGALNIYLGAGISDSSSTSPGNGAGDLLGIAAAIPGPDATTVASAVAINLTLHAGPDAVFSDSEKETLGETLGHESGHFLGLFHPVEFADDTQSTFVVGDRLSDTETCSTITECVSVGVASNLMFPSPVPGILQQRDLSSQQSRVMNLQVIVD